VRNPYNAIGGLSLGELWIALVVGFTLLLGINFPIYTMFRNIKHTSSQGVFTVWVSWIVSSDK
jgi:Tfp pilus assembly protein PilW